MSSFSQKFIIVLAAVSFVCVGLWHMHRHWLTEDPTMIKVDPEVEQQIWEMLRKSKTANSLERATIMYQIQDIGRQSIPVLVRALEHEDPHIRMFSANILQYSDNFHVIPYLQRALTDEEPTVRRSALAALGSLGAVEAVPAVVLILNDEDNFTRCQAALVLGILEHDGAVAALSQTLENDPYPVVRQTAANSLGEIGNERAVPSLIESLDDNNHLVRSASRVALHRITHADLGSSSEAWTQWWKRRESEALD